jgi:hypothetical protein
MQRLPRQPNGDVAIVERRREPRIILSIPARYALADRCDTTGNRREFSCRLINLSLRALTLLVPVNGAIGGRVITHCDEFGNLEGSIIRVLDRAFIMSIDATDEQRAKLAHRIEGYEKIKHHDLSDRRKYKRIIPKDPRSILVFGDDSRLECFIIDVSTCGAAISANITPEIGTPLAVGALVGRVVRYLPGGFAVQFIQRQSIDGLEEKLHQL